MFCEIHAKILASKYSEKAAMKCNEHVAAGLGSICPWMKAGNPALKTWKLIPHHDTPVFQNQLQMNQFPLQHTSELKVRFCSTQRCQLWQDTRSHHQCLGVPLSHKAKRLGVGWLAAQQKLNQSAASATNALQSNDPSLRIVGSRASGHSWNQWPRQKPQTKGSCEISAVSQPRYLGLSWLMNVHPLKYGIVGFDRFWTSPNWLYRKFESDFDPYRRFCFATSGPHSCESSLVMTGYSMIQNCITHGFAHVEKHMKTCIRQGSDSFLCVCVLRYVTSQEVIPVKEKTSPSRPLSHMNFPQGSQRSSQGGLWCKWAIWPNCSLPGICVCRIFLLGKTANSFENMVFSGEYFDKCNEYYSISGAFQSFHSC